MGRTQIPYESGLISYAAFASLALAVKKHGSSLGWSALPPQRVLRVLGWVLLALSAMAPVARLGLALGVTAWIAQMCVAAALLVLMLSAAETVGDPGLRWPSLRLLHRDPLIVDLIDSVAANLAASCHD
ncbi:DUF3325 domain-containing protein [Caulobacter sp. BP25]|uniref:DUF3325 domain-containing protein n=1 Tax=Caulobacter sp. BP25 TaxID=2048900 RepID=UPI0013747BE3|nr:DUF3325 domain-containing protein [Caulobacter sp. BP25]